MTTVTLADGAEVRVETADGEAYVEGRRGWRPLLDADRRREAFELAERAEHELAIEHASDADSYAASLMDEPEREDRECPLEVYERDAGEWDGLRRRLLARASAWREVRR